MFNDKPYSAVNREERFYCALLAHALLASHQTRIALAGLALERLGVDLDPNRLEVYLEVAALRDYWSDLGDPTRYSDSTHRRRRSVLDLILNSRGLDSKVIEKESLFWTSGPGSKLWSPGRWNLDELQAAGLEPLKPVRWAFNAKPDLLLISPTGGLVIEAKVESGPGKNDDVGYDQLVVQQLIVQLWQTLIPAFAKVPIRLTTLTLTCGAADCFTWSELVNIIAKEEVDPFTRQCLGRIGHNTDSNP